MKYEIVSLLELYYYHYRMGLCLRGMLQMYIAVTVAQPWLCAMIAVIQKSAVRASSLTVAFKLYVQLQL